jgi:hypothetical protein
MFNDFSVSSNIFKHNNIEPFRGSSNKFLKFENILFQLNTKYISRKIEKYL